MTEAADGSTFDGSTVEGACLIRKPAPAASLRLAATLLCHPDLARVGERALVGAFPLVRPVLVSRLEPRFYPPAEGGAAAPPGRPLGDRQLSREGFRLAPGSAAGSAEGAGALELDPAGCPHPLRLDGRPFEGRAVIGGELLERNGVVIEIADRVALLVHLLQLNEEPAPPLGLVGASAPLAELRRSIARVGPTPWPVLLRGETGSGKELAARALHQASGRPGAFLAVNMAALPSELAAAELFGARRGAFTNATADRRGLCAAADHGTLFLDEIGEASLELQAMLLRTLETGEILPVGSDKPQRVDLRVVAATDADLEKAIDEGRFRAPLLHRLGGLQLELPPLRRRRDDIPRLFLHFLGQELELLGKTLAPAGQTPWLTPDLASRLCRHAWPGNVRELRNLARRHAAFGPDEVLNLAEIREPAPPARQASPSAGAAQGGPRHPEDLGRDEVLAALQTSRYEIKGAAASLGLSRNALYALLERLELPAGAGGLDKARLEEALRLAGGDAARAARSLGVSTRAFTRRLTDLEAETPPA